MIQYNDLILSGSLNVKDGITGSLEGSSSYASFALTASYLSGSVTVETGSFATTGSNQFSGSQVVTGSLTIISGSITGSLEGTASYALTALTASYLSGSVPLETGSFATTASNQFNGSQAITGSLTIISGSITGSLVGTASYALTASNVNTLVQNITITGSIFLSGSLNKVPINRGKGDSADNLAIGTDALISNNYTTGDTGNYNVAVGISALTNNEIGFGNTAVGTQAGLNVAYNENTAIGYQTLLFAANNGQNTAIGSRAFNYLVNGGHNTALGTDAGRFVSNDFTAMNNASSSVFVGYNSRPATNGQTNQIVIGANTLGSGSNTTMIGNNSTTHTYLKGTVVATSFTGSLAGTSSRAVSASYWDGSVSSATTGSNQFDGDQAITGSLIIGNWRLRESGSNLSVEKFDGFGWVQSGYFEI